jgi:hypothetical protein
MRVMEALQKLNLAIELLGDRALFFCLFLRNLSGQEDWNYWLQIRKFPKFQAKVSISMVLREVIEAPAVIELDG